MSERRLKHFGWGREGEGLTAEEEAATLDRYSRLFDAERFEEVAFHTVCDFGQIFLRVLQEMRGGAMRFQGSIVLILLIDEEAAGIGLVPVHLVHGTSRFLAGVFGQFPENCSNVCFVSNFRHPGDSQHHHRSLLAHG